MGNDSYRLRIIRWNILNGHLHDRHIGNHLNAMHGAFQFWISPNLKNCPFGTNPSQGKRGPDIENFRKSFKGLTSASREYHPRFSQTLKIHAVLTQERGSN